MFYKQRWMTLFPNDFKAWNLAFIFNNIDIDLRKDLKVLTVFSNTI